MKSINRIAIFALFSFGIFSCFAQDTPPAVSIPSMVTSGEKIKAPGELSIAGTCTFGGRVSTWSATLTPKDSETYTAEYSAEWDGRPLNYLGIITTDLKTEIKGTGKGKGNFAFTGKYGTDGIANCDYWEDGGGRHGTLTASAPK